MARCIFQLSQQIPKATGKKANAPGLTTVQFLRKIRDSMVPQMELMQFDYTSFGETCSQLLRRMELTFIVELKHNPPKNHKQGPKAGVLAIMATDILTEGKHSGKILEQAYELLKLKDRKDWNIIVEKEKIRVIKDRMYGVQILDQPGTPKQDIVARIIKTFVDDLKAKEAKEAKGESFLSA